MMNEDKKNDSLKTDGDEKYITLTFPSQKELDDFLELQQKIKDSLPRLYELFKKYNVTE